MAQPVNVEDILGGSTNTGAVRKNSCREKIMAQAIDTENIELGIANTAVVMENDHGEKVSDRFSKTHVLGQGNFGKVRLAIEKATGRQVAIKTINKTTIVPHDSPERRRREVQIMASIKHPHIIPIYEIFENRRKFVLVMEYASGGELYDYVNATKGLEENEARRIFRQIATAIYYCHTHKICHRDIKLENILLDQQRNAKIADFGMSNVFGGQILLTTFCGSSLYSSPEIANETPYRGPEVDCWSLGVILYTLVYGYMPFRKAPVLIMAEKIAAGNYTEPDPPSSASPLIKEMLTVCPENRATIETICKHPWMDIGYTTSCLDLAEQLVIESPFELKTLPDEEPDDMGMSMNPNFQLDPTSIHNDSEYVHEQIAVPHSGDNINWCQNKLRSARKMLGRMCMCLREPQLRSQSYSDENQTSTMSTSTLELRTYNVQSRTQDLRGGTV